MPVRCPACHSDQTKPAPARNIWEQISGLLGKRSYFCEDCYRRFTPAPGNQNQSEAEEPEPVPDGPPREAARPKPAPTLGDQEPLDVIMAIPRHDDEPAPSLLSRQPQPQPQPKAREYVPEPAPEPAAPAVAPAATRPAQVEQPRETAQAPAQELFQEPPQEQFQDQPQDQPQEPPQEEESLISRMRRQMSEENSGQQDAEADEKGQGFTLPISPLRLALAVAGVVVAIVLILWYRSSLERPPQATQSATTRVKISEPAPSGGTSVSLAPTPQTPATPPTAPPAAPTLPQAPTGAPEASTTPSGVAVSQMPVSEAPLRQEPAPSEDRLSQRTKPYPRTDAPAARRSEPAAPKPAVTKPKPVAKPKPAPPKPAPPKTVASKTPPPKPSAEASSQGGYAVQFGAFTQAPRAQALAAKLKAKGVTVQIVSGKGRDGKTWHKVRSGGLPSQAEALKVQRKLEQASGMRGMVVRQAP